MKHPALISRFRDGFSSGYTAITTGHDSTLNTGIDLGIYKMAAGEVLSESNPKESAWLLLEGRAQCEWEEGSCSVERRSVFESLPWALHLPPNTSLRIESLGDGVEWCVIRAKNSGGFTPRLFMPQDVRSENRGAGHVQGACHRIVRTIFDLDNTNGANLVLGEVVNFPGRWSSYPPHHHPQPEIYHYRFTDPKGYGHAELGDDVVKVKHGDTVKIVDGVDHAQVSAPGYGMYYIWVIRHLPNAPYTLPVFTADHKWTLDPCNQGWDPSRITK